METAVYEREVVGGDAYSSKYSNLIFFFLFFLNRLNLWQFRFT